MKIVSQKGKALGRFSDTENLASNQLKAIAACVVDPLYFINNYIKIENNSKGVVPIKLHDYQEEYITTLHTQPATVAVMCRQAGTTISTMSYLLWSALFHTGSQTVIGGSSMASAQHMCHVMQLMVTEVPAWLRPNITRLSKSLIQFNNGSNIHIGVTSEILVRGRQADHVYFDNFAMSTPKNQGDVVSHLIQTITNGGKAIIASSPNGISNMFAKIYHDSLVSQHTIFFPFKKTIHDLPQFDDKWKKTMKGVIGPASWDREFECNF